MRTLDLDGNSSIGTWQSESPGVGMMTGDRKSIILVDDGDEDRSTLLRVSIPEFKIQSRMDIPTTDMPTDPDGNHVPCLDHIFVHPDTGRTYFSCELSGRTLPAQFEVDPFHSKVVEGGLPKNSATTFQYDHKSQLLYLNDGTILDSQGRRAGRIDGVQIPGQPKSYGINDMALLPNGNVVLINHTLGLGVASSKLFLYDPSAHRVLATWAEDRTYSAEVLGRAQGKNYQQKASVQLPFLVRDIPVPSRDGSHLFGIEETWGRYAGSTPPPDGGVIWDSRTLQILRRWPLPEAPSTECSRVGTGSGLIACFAPAPDGRGMWYFGKSGKIYRLDDHTGDLIEEVKLPFHFISLIREP
jgi:hypothetical protein